MYLVMLGVLLLVGKMAQFGPMADLSWWVVLGPFAGAVLWWHFADTYGWTKRRQMNKMEERKRERRQRSLEALGLDVARDKRASATRADVVRRATGGVAPGARGSGQPDAGSKRGSVDPTL